MIPKMDYLTQILLLTLVYSCAAKALALISDDMGLLAVCQAAFFGIGAYSYALLSEFFGGELLAIVGFSSVSAVFSSCLISFSSVRLRKDYFVLVTFAFQTIWFTLVNNSVAITRGPLGMPVYTKPSLMGVEITSAGARLGLVATIVVACFCAVESARRSAFGLVLRGLREDDLFIQAQARNPLYYRATAFAVAAGFGSTAGVLYAALFSYVSPAVSTIYESILILAMVIIGGSGTVLGPLVGASILVSLPELLRFLGIQGPAAANARQIIYGLLLIILVALRAAVFNWRARVPFYHA